MTVSATAQVPARWTTTAVGAGLLLVVLAHVVKGHYLQIEWHTTVPVPAAWWFAAEAAEALGGPLFFAAAGLGLGRLRDQRLTGMLLTRVVPNLVWYAAASAAGTVLLWRFGPGYGLTPIRDLPELLRQAVLPPSGLAPVYALAVFPLLAWLCRRLPTPLVLGAAATAGVLVAVAATRVPVLATSAELTRYLLFFLIGWRLGRLGEAIAARAVLLRFLLAAAVFAMVALAFAAAGEQAYGIRPLLLGLAALPCGVAGAALLAARPAGHRPLTAVGLAAAPIAAALVPITAVTGAFVVKRLSLLDGPVQLLVAVAEPVLLTAAIVVAGLVAHRVTPRIAALRPVPAAPAEATR